MANLQETLDALQPYVIGIRYLEGVPVIDAVFKPNWTLPESDTIKRVRGNEEVNYYMIFSDKKGIGLDDLLEFVNRTIKMNIERENKHQFLKDKVNELKELFKKTPLSKLKHLKFVLIEEEIISDDDFDLEEVTEPHSLIPQQPTQVETPSADITQQPEINEADLTEEELEILAEERRAENFRKIKQTENWATKLKPAASSVELPPKKVEEAVPAYAEFDSECECGPEAACSKCIDRKGY